MFQPATRTDGLAPLRSAVRYVAFSVVDSPGQRLTWLSVQRTGSTGAPAAPTTCASTKNAGTLPEEPFFSVTSVVVLPSPFVVEDAVVSTPTWARPFSPDRSAYDVVGV